MGYKQSALGTFSREVLELREKLLNFKVNQGDVLVYTKARSLAGLLQTRLIIPHQEAHPQYLYRVIFLTPSLYYYIRCG